MENSRYTLANLLFLTLISFSIGTSQAFQQSCENLFGTNPTISRSLPYQLESTILLKRLATKISDFEHYALSEYGNEGWQWAVDSADEHALTLLNKLRSLGKPYEKLIIDPGLLQHIDQFIEYAKNNPVVDPWKARDRFASLPELQTTVYRGVALTEVELSKVRTHGFTNGFSREFGRRRDPTNSGLLRGRSQSLHAHQSLGSSMSVFQSVTDFPELAAGVAQGFEARGSGTEKTYVFELRLSKVDLISLEKSNGVFPHSRLTGGNGGELTLRRNGFPDQVFPADSRVERFYLWNIPARAIVTYQEFPDRIHYFISRPPLR